MIEILVEFILEFLLQGVGELLLEIFTHRARKHRHAKGLPAREPMHPVLSALLWIAIGAAIGWLTLIPFPHSFLKDPALRIANLIATPLVLGALMALLGRRRLANREETVPLDRFWTAALFALSMGLVRFFLAK